MTRHIACMRAALVALVAGYALTTGLAWAQEPTTVVATASDPTMQLVVDLLKGGGLPGVLALVAWWARGQLGAGIPVVVRLSDDDRRLLRSAAGEPTDPGVSRP